ncbi:MAG: hypothetical protein V1875_07095 [Candidatus Altiarchaeota archaeon]
MHYVKQLFQGKPEEWVHLQFTRYGRGLFDGPYVEVDAGKDIKFKGSVEYSTVLGQLAASGGGDFKVEGAIYAKKDFRDDLRGLGVEFDDKSKVKRSFFVAELSGDFPSAVLVDIYSKVPHATVLLNFAGAGGKFKCKKKPPKPGGEKVNDFCSGSMALSALPKLKGEVLFDVGDFKKAVVDNKFQIESLTIPPGMSSADARLYAKRKGKVLRTVTVDGVDKKSEVPFEV